MSSLLEAPATVEIKGASYAVETIPAGECGRAAVRVTKLVNGESYDVIRTDRGIIECSCPDFVCRHEGKGTLCKHGASMLARGFLDVPAPISGGSPVVVAPITRADLKRAAMWGLKLPAAPRGVEAPVDHLRDVTKKVEATVDHPVDVNELVEVPAIVAPAGWNLIEADDQADEDAGHYGPSGDSWETWQDDGVHWTTTDEPARSDIDLTSFCRTTPPAVEVDLGFAELAVGFLTDSALGLIEEDRIEEALGIFDGLEAENAAAFEGFVASLGTPGLTWLEWLNRCQSGEPVSFPSPPAPRSGRFVPTAEQDAERLGFELGLAGEDAAPRARTPLEADAFRRGWLAGRASLETERNIYLDALEAEAREIHHDELAEAGGVGLARVWR